MYKIIFSVLIILFTTSGCSLLPRLTFSSPGNTPQTTVKSQKDERCAGEYKVDTEGNIISCTKGYINKQSNYKQAERAYTFSEKVANFIRGLAGWGFWGLAILLILVPGLAGWLIGRVYNVFKSALTGTVAAITKFRKNIPTVVLDGQTVQDPAYVKAVDDLLDALEVEHKADPAILKTILDIRTQLKITDND